MLVAWALAVLPLAASGAEDACAVPSGAAVEEDTVALHLQRGECALQAFRYDEAVRRFKAVLARSDNPIAHAQLGRAYLGLQQFERARSEFLAALAAQPPEAARTLLQQFVQLAEQQRTRAREWVGQWTLGYLLDSNTNLGPRQAEVELFGLPFTMDPGALPKASSGWQAGLNLSHHRVLGPDLNLVSHAALSQTGYNQNPDLGLAQLAVDSGPQLQLTPQLSLGLPLGYGRTLLGGRSYLDSLSLQPQAVWRRGAGQWWVGSLNWSANRYAQAPARDAQNQQLSFGVRQVVAEQWTWETSLKWGRDQARDEAFSQHYRGLQAGVSGSPAPGWRWSASAQLSTHRFAQAEAWAAEPRQDRRSSVSLQLGKDLGGGYYGTLAYTESQIHSNLALYHSVRRQTLCQVSKDF